MNTVYVVHSVDAEGPLNESIEETFVRIENFFGKLNFTATPENLKKLQNKELTLPDEKTQRADFDRAFSPSVLNYMKDFGQLDQMISRVMSPEFRKSIPDDDGNPWIYNWHCLDHLNYEENPRQKIVGMHQIFDYYRSKIKQTNSTDQLHWHFHPATFYGEGSRSTTNYTYSTQLYRILSKRVIERSWFPVVNRAGYHTERIDSHLFLEQWIPFDLSNQAMPEEDAKKTGLQAGRFGDWRGAPSDWSWYRPSHDHYQIPGNCRRVIGRCLNIGTRHHLLNQTEVDKAFALAQKSGKALLAVTNHDFREMSQDMTSVHAMLKDAKTRFPNVRFKYQDAAVGTRNAVFSESVLKAAKPIQLKLSLEKNIARIQCTEGQTFGIQPFFCFKTKDRRFLYDNLDIVQMGSEWSYTFDLDTIPLDAIETIGVASNDKYGFQDIHILPVN